MIELIIKQYLDQKLAVDVYLERPEDPPSLYVVFEKTGSSEENYFYSSTFAFQSYAPTMYETTALNDLVKRTIEGAVELDEIASISLNTDYNFTDPTTKEYRYQAVYEIFHYRKEEDD